MHYLDAEKTEISWNRRRGLSEKEGMKKQNIYYFETREQVEELVKKIWQSGDSILFKASNGMKFFNIVENLIK